LSRIAVESAGSSGSLKSGIARRARGPSECNEVGVAEDLAARTPGAVGLVVDEDPNPQCMVVAEAGGSQHQPGDLLDEARLAVVVQRARGDGDVDPESRLGVRGGDLGTGRELVQVGSGQGPEEVVVGGAPSRFNSA
jgi:hypothetical protein